MPCVGRAFVAATVVAVLAASLPQAAGLAPSIQVFGSLDMPIPIGLLWLDASPKPATTDLPPGIAAPYCNRDSFTGDEATRSFTFRDGDQEASCLGVRYNVSLPQGTRSFHLSFDANRSVTQQLPGAVDMVQTVRLLVNGEPYQSHDVFGANDLKRSRGSFPAMAFEIPEGASSVQVEWRFEDGGNGGKGRLESFSATVWDPFIHLDDVPLHVAQVSAGEPNLRDGAYESPWSVEVAVPSAFVSAAAVGQFSLRVVADANASLRLDGVDGPSGAAITGLYSFENSGRTITVTIPQETLRTLGAGPYTIRLAVPETLQRHTTYELLSYIMLAAPALAIGVAWAGLRRTEIESGLEGET